MSEANAIAPKNSLLPFRREAPAEKTTASKEQITSLIAHDAVFSGDMVLQDGVKVDGQVHGNITIKNKSALVVVSPNASVNGNIDAGRVYVNGKVNGSIRAKIVMLSASAYVEGDIFYQSLQVAEGAELSGSIHKFSEHQVRDSLSNGSAEVVMS